MVDVLCVKQIEKHHQSLQYQKKSRVNLLRSASAAVCRAVRRIVVDRMAFALRNIAAVRVNDVSWLQQLRMSKEFLLVHRVIIPLPYLLVLRRTEAKSLNILSRPGEKLEILGYVISIELHHRLGFALVTIVMLHLLVIFGKDTTVLLQLVTLVLILVLPHVKTLIIVRSVPFLLKVFVLTKLLLVHYSNFENSDMALGFIFQQPRANLMTMLNVLSVLDLEILDDKNAIVVCLSVQLLLVVHIRQQRQNLIYQIISHLQVMIVLLVKLVRT
mmetsp:Transcript_9613/g.13311  ORF Transcript_9613/g.13311 Transcript_9613/m.13311 type:complete len:272 (-) Transcript_9613:177-992(-)